MIRTAILATLFALFLLIAAVDAWSSEQMAAITPLPSYLSVLEYALTPAAAYWQAEGRTLSCKPQLHLYDERGADRDEVIARADMPGCDIYWNRRVLRRVLRDAYDRWRALAAEGLRRICQTATHEYGHNLGLDHTEYGIMSPDAGWWEWEFPDGTRAGGWTAECKTWARAILHDRRVRRQKRGVTNVTQHLLDSALRAL